MSTNYHVNDKLPPDSVARHRAEYHRQIARQLRLRSWRRAHDLWWSRYGHALWMRRMRRFEMSRSDSEAEAAAVSMVAEGLFGIAPGEWK